MPTPATTCKNIYISSNIFAEARETHDQFDLIEQRELTSFNKLNSDRPD